MRAVVVSAITLALAFSAGCPPPKDTGDHVAPHILAVDPSVPVVAVDTTFRFVFSEALNPNTISSDVTADNLTIVLASRDLINDTFLSDVRNPPLSATRQNDVVPIDVALADGDTTLTVAPRAPLPAGTAFTLIVSAEVRDASGNPLVDASGHKNPFLYEFTTDAGPPVISSTDLPSGAGLVVPNRKRFTVVFNQPVVGISASTLFIQGSPTPDIEAILVEDDVQADRTVPRARATILLTDPAAGCGRLATGATYTLVGTNGIKGDTGQTLTPFAQDFTTGGACDLTGNVMDPPSAIAADVTASVRFTTSKPSTSEVRFGITGGTLDCLGGPCPVIGANTTAAGQAHTVTVTGLTVGVTYDFVASAEDETGAVATRSGSFTTAALPKVSVNEMLADANGSSDNAGEFVEVANFDSAPIDISGFTLRVTKQSGGAPNDCAVPAATSVPAGGFIVLADDTFDPTLYTGMDTSTVVHIVSWCGLQNEAIIVELVDLAQRPISSMTALAPHTGQSVERITPDAPDDSTSFCFQAAPTPGAINGVVLRGCQ